MLKVKSVRKIACSQKVEGTPTKLRHYFPVRSQEPGSGEHDGSSR